MRRILTLMAAALCALVSLAASASSVIGNIHARQHQSLNGRWNYIIDPYETGFYDYRRMPFDASASARGGYFDDRSQVDKGELVEYNFDLAPTMAVPGDWNSQAVR